MFKLDVEKAEEPEIKFQHLLDHRKKKQENSREPSTSAKAFDCVDHNKLKNSLRDGNTRPPYLHPEKSV